MFVLLGMVFFILTKTLTLSPLLWNVFLAINIMLSVGGAIILLLYMRNEKKRRTQ